MIERTTLGKMAIALLRIILTILVTAVALDIAAYFIADKTIPIVNIDGSRMPIVGVGEWVSVIMWSGSIFLALSLTSMLLLSYATNGFLADKSVDFAFAQSITIFPACFLVIIIVCTNGSVAASIPANLGIDLASYQLSAEGNATISRELVV